MPSGGWSNLTRFLARVSLLVGKYLIQRIEMVSKKRIKLDLMPFRRDLWL